MEENKLGGNTMDQIYTEYQSLTTKALSEHHISRSKGRSTIINGRYEGCLLYTSIDLRYNIISHKGYFFRSKPTSRLALIKTHASLTETHRRRGNL